MAIGTNAVPVPTKSTDFLELLLAHVYKPGYERYFLKLQHAHVYIIQPAKQIWPWTMVDNQT